MVEEPLNEDIMKELHRILKQSIKDFSYEAKTDVTINDIIHFPTIYQTGYPRCQRRAAPQKLVSLLHR